MAASFPGQGTRLHHVMFNKEVDAAELADLVQIGERAGVKLPVLAIRRGIPFSIMAIGCATPMLPVLAVSTVRGCKSKLLAKATAILSSFSDAAGAITLALPEFTTMARIPPVGSIRSVRSTHGARS